MYRMADIISKGSRLVCRLGVATLTHICDLLAQCFRNGTEQSNPHRTVRSNNSRRLSLKCDGTRAETRFRLSAKRTSPFKSAGTSVQSTTGSRGVRISGSNAGYTMFRGSVKSTGYPLHSSVSPSLPVPCVTVCHHISTGLYATADSARCVDLYDCNIKLYLMPVHYFYDLRLSWG
jgi:hypothetical protein